LRSKVNLGAARKPALYGKEAPNVCVYFRFYEKYHLYISVLFVLGLLREEKIPPDADTGTSKAFGSDSRALKPLNRLSGVNPWFVSSRFTNVATDSRFGIGSSFVAADQPADEIPAVAANSPAKAVTPHIDEKVSSSTSNPVAVEQHDPSKFCSICLVTVTSDSQMKMHMDGIKHAKKLKSLG
jgi:Zinc-finger of C2H2 type